MILLCRVCAEFRDAEGTLLHKVGIRERNLPHQAPDNIVQDPLFGLLESDGTLTAVYTKEEQKKLENMDPTAGVDASGKRIPPVQPDPEPNGKVDLSEIAGITGTVGNAETAGTSETGTASETSASGKKETKSAGRARKTAGE